MKIMQSTPEQEDLLDDRLTAFNQQAKPMTQEKPAVVFSYSAMDGDEMIGGIYAYASQYHIGYVDSLWVADNRRRQGIGTELLQQAETALREFGCAVVHLETFDFQGPEFYRANGYHVFGQLDYPNAELTEYFLAKEL